MLRLLLLFAGVATAALALTSPGAAAPADNGVSAESPTAILAAAVSAADHAHSVHVEGHNGKAGAGHLGLDLWFEGTSLRGRVDGEGIAFDLIVIGDTAYVKGSPTFYRKVAPGAASGAIALLANKWLEGSIRKGGIFAGIVNGLELRQLLGGVRSHHGTLEKTGLTVVRGRPAIGLHDITGGGTVYVATTGTPYPLLLQKAGKQGAFIEFEDWNAPLRITAPRSVVNAAALTKPTHP